MPAAPTLTHRLLILIPWWVLQALVLWCGYVLVAWTFGNRGFDPPSPAEFVGGMFESEVLSMVAIWVPVLTLLQGLFLLPLHFRPRKGGRRRSVLVSLAAGAMLVSLLAVAFVAACTELVVLMGFAESRGWSFPAMFAGLGVSWCFFTALLVRYSRRSSLDDHDLLISVARILFRGTIIQTVALIPVDIMVRRKTDCYCWSGSFFALILSGAVGLVVAGPAIFLPLFVRRERHRRRGLCPWCDYDLSGTPPETPCPECGTRRGEGST